jgi:hypothetical protein
MVPRWAVVDKLVHELGSLRAVVDEIDARPDLAQDDVALELRASLGRAADTIHLVIGGDDAMVAQAWRTIADAQEVGARVRLAMERAHATRAHAGAIRQEAKARGGQTRRHIDDLQALKDRSPIPRSAGAAVRHKD